LARNRVTGLLFAAFLAVPIIEIALFIQVGGWLGLWPTLGIVVLTAIAGTALMRAQGLATLAEFQRRMRAGENPTGLLAHGAMILFAGALLLTPGFFTDAVGFSLLLPPVRSAIIAYMARHAVVQTSVFTSRTTASGTRDDTVIDAEYERIDPESVDDNGPKGSSGWTKGR